MTYPLTGSAPGSSAQLPEGLAGPSYLDPYIPDITKHHPGGCDLPRGPAGSAEHYDAPPRTGAVAICTPGVILSDVSPSMAGVLATADQFLQDFAVEMRRHPLVAETTYLGLVSFADTAHTELDLCQIANPANALPRLTVRGNGTNYAAALREGHARLRADLPRLGRTVEGNKRMLNRPTLYLFGDGQHNCADDPFQALAELEAEKWAPTRFAFGFGDADEQLMRRIASPGCAYFAKQGYDASTILQQILKVILRSLLVITDPQRANTHAPVAPDPQQDPATQGLVRLDTLDPDSLF